MYHSFNSKLLQLITSCINKLSRIIFFGGWIDWTWGMKNHYSGYSTVWFSVLQKHRWQQALNPSGRWGVKISKELCSILGVSLADFHQPWPLRPSEAMGKTIPFPQK